MAGLDGVIPEGEFEHVGAVGRDQLDQFVDCFRDDVGGAFDHRHVGIWAGITSLDEIWIDRELGAIKAGDYDHGA